MSEEQLKELQEYNLEYLEAQASEEMFGGDFTSAVELKQAKREIEKLNNIRNKAINFLKENACIDEDVKYFCDDLRYDDCKKIIRNIRRKC